MARRRTLRPEEEALWQAVAKTATPLHPVRDHAPVANLPPALVQEKPAEAEPLPRFMIRERGGALPVPKALSGLGVVPVRMDAKTFGRMSKGRIAPEARIDLHGMTVAEAQPELIRFVLNAHAQGVRLVLVITGKGRPGTDSGPIPRRQGVLRQQVPEWLRQAPLGPVVQQVAEAHLKHGGAGAVYVYLRRGAAGR